MVEDQVDRRPRRQRRQLLEELHGLEEQVRRAVAPRPLQLHPHAAVAQQSQPVVGQRRAEEVAAQMLQTRRVVGAHPHVGVQIEALDVRLACPPGINCGGAQIPEPAHPCPGPRAQGHAPLDRGARDPGQRRGRLGERVVGPGPLVLWLQAAAPQEPPHAPPDGAT